VQAIDSSEKSQGREGDKVVTNGVAVGHNNHRRLIMASAFHDPLSPFSDPHRDAPWPATPHTAADLPPTLVRAPSAQSQVAAIDTNISNGTNGGLGTGPWGKEPQIYGQPEPGLISPQSTKPSNGQALEKPEPYLRVRITALDRNRRDILVRFDAQASLPQSNGNHSTHLAHRPISQTLRVLRTGTYPDLM